MVLRLRVPKYHCLSCNRYFRHRFAGIVPRRRATEKYRLEVFEAHEGGVSQRKLSVTHQVGSTTVERWYQSFVKQRVSELSGRACPQVLDRSQASLRSYLRRLPGKENVRIIVMDMSETYRRIAQQYFPNAMIVAD